MPRRAFDAWLLQQLPPNVRIETGTPVIALHKREKPFAHWCIERVGKPPVYARFVVGADGVASRVAAQVEAYHRIGRPPVFPAVRGYVEANKPEALELHFEQALLPGYRWTFPTACGLNVGAGSPAHQLRRRKLTLREFLRERWSGIEKLEGHGIPVALGRRPLSAPGCALVGDAAALADPFTGEGIGNALLSGVRLAEAMAGVPMTKWHEADWEQLYTRPLYGELARELRITRLLYRVAQKGSLVEGILRLMGFWQGGVEAVLKAYGAR